MKFSPTELRDLAVAWLVLGLAFAVFANPLLLRRFALVPLAEALGISLATVGVAFLLHELAHKVVAVRFGQVAEFRADYGLLFLALMGAFVGFLFAAPGAVHHRGYLDKREHGLIALAGPVTNLALAVPFFALTVVPGPLAEVASLGVTINLILAGFNMVPWGPLDGRTVYEWSKPVFGAVFVPSVALGLAAIFGIAGLGL